MSCEWSVKDQALLVGHKLLVVYADPTASACSADHSALGCGNSAHHNTIILTLNHVYLWKNNHFFLFHTQLCVLFFTCIFYPKLFYSRYCHTLNVSNSFSDNSNMKISLSSIKPKSLIIYIYI